MPTSPTPIAVLPTPPSRSDPANFAARGDAFLGALPTFATEANAIATNAYSNTLETVNSANTASSAASTATAQADAAMGYRNTAQNAATTATTKANEASASATAASKLNLGDKVSPPTVDNQGQALRAGTTYYDTTLGKWRVWNGSAWAEGISSVAGVSSLNGLNGALNLSTLSGYGITDAVKQTVALAPGTDLNSVVTSGFYRLDGPHPNWPSKAVEYGQMIVSRGSDTILQITTGFSNGRMWFRQAAGIGATPSWGPWRRLAEHSETPTATWDGVMDCSLGSYFTLITNGNYTLSFVNIPLGAYSCVLEVQYTVGTITFPAGTVWSGAAPTLSPGRHLFFFQRAQLGTAGWYASALPGYSA